MRPLVSILIPNYNKSRFLRKTIDSVISQTYSNWECIIVDDHSTDNSWQILEEYALSNSRINIFKRPRDIKKGGNGARNYGIMQSTGKYVAFLDSDDIWQSNRLEQAINFLESENIESIYSGAIVVKPNLTEKLSSRSIGYAESVFDFILSDGVFCPTPSFVMKRNLAKIVLFDENLKRHQDYDFFIRAHLVSPWKYFENYDVQVNWTRADLKNINYYNCLPFYEKHWEKSKNKVIRYKYIIRITSSSVRESCQNNIAAYFRCILKKEGYSFSFREYILFYFPYLFFALSKVKWTFRSFLFRLRIFILF